MAVGESPHVEAQGRGDCYDSRVEEGIEVEAAAGQDRSSDADFGSSHSHSGEDIR